MIEPGDRPVAAKIVSKMPPFPKPRTRFDYDLGTELAALRAHKKLRGVPKRSRDRLQLCTNEHGKRLAPTPPTGPLLQQPRSKRSLQRGTI